MNPIVQQLRSFQKNYSVQREHLEGKYFRSGIFLDYLMTALRLGASASDYFEYEFYRLKHKARKEYACRKLKRKFLSCMNDPTKAHIFNNKTEFLTLFSEYTKRDFVDTAICTEEEFRAFEEKHPICIAKPQNSSCGNGIRRLESYESSFVELKKQGTLLEELIVQCEEMRRLNPSSLNSVRVATVYRDGRMKILGAALRCGSGGSCIDNYCNGGYAAKVDPETGTVISDGCNIANRRVSRHPDTGVYFHGFTIPHWDKVLDMLNSAVKKVDGVGYVGWDVAIREDDAVLIEGNFEGMFNLLQVPARQGIRDEVMAILRECGE